MMASQAAKSLNHLLMSPHRKIPLLLLSCHHSQIINTARLSVPHASNSESRNTARLSVPHASNSENRAPPPLSLVLRPFATDLDLFTNRVPFYKQHKRTVLSQNQIEQRSCFIRSLSTKMGKVQSFDTKDTCSVFDENGMLIKETTFGQAKLLASSHNSRLVYMNKNADGLLCFSLQRTPAKVVDSRPSKENISRSSDVKKKDTKAAAKEYKIKASIADRDLKIKTNQMQSHLIKGKQVILFIKENVSRSSNSAGEKGGGSEIMKKVKAELGNLCKVNQDYSNATTTRLTLSPKEQVSSTVSDEESKVVNTNNS